jgi:hypothetical protein
MSRAKLLEAVSGWSCKQRDRTACRDPDGCHCREITALRNTVNYLRDEAKSAASAPKENADG